MKGHLLRSIYAFALLNAVVITSAPGQLASPGKLSSAHAKLEGVGSCTKCHNFGEQTFRNNCLACHTEIQSRVEDKHGYHYYTRKLECNKCHKEHHGRKFNLIRWNPDKFDHKQTGFELEGKHDGLQCGNCHNPGNITARDIKKKSKEQQKRTFLGLTTACDNCHEDEHRGQFKHECSKCHTPVSWENQSFSHASARFKLQGRHSSVDCAKCHPTEQDSKTIHGDTRYLKFRGIAYAQCSACHTDPHNGGFGVECSSCHNPTGWKDLKLNAANFDHSKTHFPLQGRHAALQCVQCHNNGGFGKFEGADLTKCTTCHQDYHIGQFASREKQGECSACHSVEGFTPALFTPAQHTSTRFALTGAHAAIPCGRCHVMTTIDGQQTPQFVWTDLRCRACHNNPHGGQFSERIAENGCTDCHSTESWYWMEFDHSATDFALVGKHQSVLCEKCHTDAEIGGVKTKRFVFQSTGCADCHADQHQGQFADKSGTVDCSRCHTPYGWKHLTFDHNSMAAFKLTGKHAELECSRCHVPAQPAEGMESVIKYKPIGTQCSSCHAPRD